MKLQTKQSNYTVTDRLETGKKGAAVVFEALEADEMRESLNRNISECSAESC